MARRTCECCASRAACRLSCSSRALSSSMSGECRKEPHFRLPASQHACRIRVSEHVVVMRMQC